MKSRKRKRRKERDLKALRSDENKKMREGKETNE